MNKTYKKLLENKDIPQSFWYFSIFFLTCSIGPLIYLKLTFSTIISNIQIWILLLVILIISSAFAIIALTKYRKNRILISSLMEHLVRNTEKIIQSSENFASSHIAIMKGSTQQVEALNDILTNFDELTQGIQNIRKEVKNIDSISDIISRIADKTNILAINATIEASRAGEAGIGLKSVAEYVQKLADESQKQVSETERKLKEITEITSLQEKNTLEIDDSIRDLTIVASTFSSTSQQTNQAAQEILDLTASIKKSTNSLLTSLNLDESSPNDEKLTPSSLEHDGFDDDLKQLFLENDSGMTLKFDTTES
ncbi:methyl-accepting chemotaxis protein [Candidatus Lokiarchaeum ossiferum]|uniref:methyl-accepting chemotaxis protein n=1 Tax=Candidatus Lokiarchaeum ossiferum TaxID=2951803 RepID=UPI00352F7122